MIVECSSHFVLPQGLVPLPYGDGITVEIAFGLLCWVRPHGRLGEAPKGVPRCWFLGVGY